ncbi:hypothetical protein BDV32DRAFT_80073 [Aspergillus pseudonomiae]|nr:hypothetical protein BDV32DRAFT_80073 [Aspergillus pseudonomiae]
MVIDLTGDSDSEDQIRSQLHSNIKSATPNFFTHLAHRTPLPSVPLKRKSEKSPESELYDAFFNFRKKPLAPSVGSSAASSSAPHQNNKPNGCSIAPALQPSTPSPSPAITEQSLPAQVISVVVPSPSRQLKKEIESAKWAPSARSCTPELKGVLEKFYPTNAHVERGLKGAYPAARKVNRAAIPLPIGTPGPILKKRPEALDQQYRTLQRKLSMIKGPKVTCAPDDGLKLAKVTANFEFINSYKLHKGVSPAPAEFIGGCSCGKYCDPDRCPCSEKEDDSTENIIPYQRARDRPDLLVLTPEFLKRSTMIFECGAKCACDKGCWNRVVQRGRTVELEIFHTGNRGFGLRSPSYIRAGQFIDCYLGEVITKKHADIREDIALKNGHSYLFGLDFSPEVDEADIYVVDGQRFGCATRFMNHSCRPNCRMFTVTNTIGDERLYNLAFFALNDIPPMTELTFDYNPGTEKSTQVDSSVVACLCGEDNCRGQLWPSKRKGTK